MESRVCPQCGSRWYSANCTSTWVCERCGAEIPRVKSNGGESAEIKDSGPIETFFRGVNKAGSDAKETLDKLSRKGCNYCSKTNPEYAGYSDIWNGNKLSIGYGNYIEINFCPICGRYLKG